MPPTYPTVTQSNLELTPMQVWFSAKSTRKVCTFTVATPGKVNVTAHGYSNGDRVFFTNSGGALPVAIKLYVPYYVANKTANDFEVSLTSGGSSIAFATVGTGTSSVQKEVDLGGSLGNVAISMKYMKAEIKADQFGQTVLDRRVSGVEVTATTELVEVQNFDIWKVVFPHGSELSTGGSAFAINTNIGDSDSSNAGNLRLHPLSKTVDDHTYDYDFFSACGNAESAITYGPTEQNRLKIVWNILPDFGFSPARFMVFGDVIAS